MNTTRTLIGKLNLMTHSGWLLPASLALALVTAVFAMTGCQPQHM